MSMFSDWTPSELDYLLSLSDLELQSTMEGVPESDRALLTKAMLARLKALENDQIIPTKLQLCEKLVPPCSITMLDRYIAKGMQLKGPPFSLLASQEEYERVRKETGVDDSGSDAELRRERLRAEIAEKVQSERAKRIKNDILEGNAYHAEDVDQWIGNCFERIKTRLEQFPQEAAVGIAPEQRDAVRQMLETGVYELLIEMSGWAFEASREVGNVADGET